MKSSVSQTVKAPWEVSPIDQTKDRVAGLEDYAAEFEHFDINMTK